MTKLLRPEGRLARVVAGVSVLMALLPVAAAAQDGPSPQSASQPWRATYAVSLIGLPIGTANVTAALDLQRYKVEVQARLTGLAGMVTGGRGAGSASGALAAGRVQSAGYAASGTNGRESRTVRMALSAGQATAIEIVPPIVKKPDAVPVEDGHRRGITDPVSALLMSVPAGKDPASPAACDRTIAIFDGNARYDIALSFSSVKQVQSKSYTGPVAVCSARYVPISGHRNNRATRFMAENREIEAWLAPVGGQLVAPYRISVRSEIGTVVIEATRFEAANLPTTTASTRRAARTE
jgi:hypothetical protein